MNNSYVKELKYFQSCVSHIQLDENYSHSLESMFESLKDWSQLHTLEEVKAWFKNKRETSSLQVSSIPIKEMNDWQVDSKTGNIFHRSNDFFVIHGLRTTSKNREVLTTWDQPILEQVGYDGGLIGIIRKRFHGIPHYLCEAKEEPGNYGKVQISPSLQATFANLRQVHGGRKPHFAELFMTRNYSEKIKILFDAWLAEDGGRLHLKRNRGILIEVNEKFEIPKPNDNFIWLSLYQIKQLLNEDAWINPHVRSIIAHV